MSAAATTRFIARIMDRGDASPLFSDHGRRRDPLPLPDDLRPPKGAIVAFTRRRDGETTDFEVLAEAGSARATLYNLLLRHRINPLYPPEVLAEVDHLLANPDIDDPTLADLTHLPFVTIDNDDSRDLDQALQLERSGSGFILRYALADAAHYVRPGSALFAEALERGASYYLPSFAVPMLPPALSEGIISLNPDVLRRALVFVLTLDADGHLLETELQRGRIRSRAKLSYNGVQELFDHGPGHPLANQVFSESLSLMAEVGELRIALESERNVISFDRTEIEIMLADEAGERFTFSRESRNAVSCWNEQISLLCNIAGAQLLASGGAAEPEVQPVFRVHVPPSPERLAELREIISAVVAHHGFDEAAWVWRATDPRESLADYLARLPHEPATLAVRHSLERQILISNRRSTFSSEPGLHYALGVTPYSRFSAPMREIVGIFTHKEALEKLGLIEPIQSPQEDTALRERVIEAANRSKQRQGQLTNGIKQSAVSRLLGRDLDHPLAERPTYSGTILGVRATRLYVRLDEPPVEIKVYSDRLEEFLACELPYAAGDVALRDLEGNARFAIGDRIRLRTHSSEPDGHRWYLVPDVD